MLFPAFTFRRTLAALGLLVLTGMEPADAPDAAAPTIQDAQVAPLETTPETTAAAIEEAGDILGFEEPEIVPAGFEGVFPTFESAWNQPVPDAWPYDALLCADGNYILYSPYQVNHFDGPFYALKEHVPPHVYCKKRYYGYAVEDAMHMADTSFFAPLRHSGTVLVDTVPVAPYPYLAYPKHANPAQPDCPTACTPFDCWWHRQSSIFGARNRRLSDELHDGVHESTWFDNVDDYCGSAGEKLHNPWFHGQSVRFLSRNRQQSDWVAGRLQQKYIDFVPFEYTVIDFLAPPERASELRGPYYESRLAQAKARGEQEAAEEDGLKSMAAVTTNITPPEGELPENIALARFAREGELDGTGTDGREWLAQTKPWRASALCHEPLYFEEVNLERYGHSYGILQVFVTTGQFYGTAATLPVRMLLEPPRECLYTLGHYRPGSPAPFQFHESRPKLEALRFGY